MYTVLSYIFSSRDQLHHSAAGERAALPEWQAAIVADLSGPTMFARIGVMRALNRHRFERMSAPSKKRAKAYRIISACQPS
ncbi:hypothetical protein GWE18_15025 [Bradyrhizobium sp. CSA112]|nr:hypothetical protein [Bradyrhizobium sp. CSA112]